MPPKSPKNWLDEDLGSTKPLDVLRKVHGHDRFRPEQGNMVSAIADGDDAGVIMRTGEGKSLGWEIPAVLSEKGEVTVVASPLCALIKDQVARARALGIPVAEYHGGLDDSQRARQGERIKNRKVAVVYTTPEQCATQAFRSLFKNGIRMLAVDEAHCVAEWGHDFRTDYSRLGEFREALEIPQCAAFTATASENTKREMIEVLGLGQNGNSYYETPEKYQRSVRPNLSYSVQGFEGGRAASQMIRAAADRIREFTTERDMEKGIVYCLTRKRVDDMVDTLRKMGLVNTEGKKLRIRGYHAQKKDSYRRDVERDFHNGDVDLLVATIAFGMGIDDPDIEYVINDGMPDSASSYLQQTGRAGRNGGPAECVLHHSGRDTRINTSLNEKSTPEIAFADRVLTTIEELARSCRRSDVVNGLLEEDDTFYRIYMPVLLSKFNETKPSGYIVNQDTAVNAVLFEFLKRKILERYDNYWAIHGYGESGSSSRTAVARSLSKRRRIKQLTLAQMIRYTQIDIDDCQRQEFLQELMAEDLTSLA